VNDFVPFGLIAPQPDAGGFVAMPSPPAGGTSRPYFAARCPISRTVDLNEMASGELLAGVIYRRDLFLCGPFEGAVQGLWLSSSRKAVQTSFQVGLIDDEGALVAAMRQLTELPERARLLLDVAAETSNRSLYLRVETQAQDALLYVTLDVTLDEVM
jgi:hypothetical protein